MSTGADGAAPAALEAVDVFPEGGRLAMFYSADMPHEVGVFLNLYLRAHS